MTLHVVFVVNPFSRNPVSKDMNCFIPDIKRFHVNCVIYRFLQSRRSQDTCGTTRARRGSHVRSATSRSLRISILSFTNASIQGSVLIYVNYVRSLSILNQNLIVTCALMQIDPSDLVFVQHVDILCSSSSHVEHD